MTVCSFLCDDFTAMVDCAEGRESFISSSVRLAIQYPRESDTSNPKLPGTKSESELIGEAKKKQKTKNEERKTQNKGRKTKNKESKTKKIK